MADNSEVLRIIKAYSITGLEESLDKNSQKMIWLSFPV